MFLSTIQKTEPRISPYEDVHLRMGEKFSTVYTVPPSYVFMVVHGGNRSNIVNVADKFIDAIDSRESGIQGIRQVSNITKHHEAKGNDWRNRIRNVSKVN